MQRSSESVAALASALAKAQAELVQKSRHSHDQTCRTGRNAAHLSLCAAVERPRYRAQNPGSVGNRNHTEHGHRPDIGLTQFNNGAGAFLRRMDPLGLARKLRARIAWALPSPTRVATRCSRSLASRARTILMPLT
jgi:hypothetical protein